MQLPHLDPALFGFCASSLLSSLISSFYSFLWLADVISILAITVTSTIICKMKTNKLAHFCCILKFSFRCTFLTNYELITPTISN